MKDEIFRALNGERRALARVLSAIENRTYSLETVGGENSSIAEKSTWNTMAITGAPGVGKSVLVDALMTLWAQQGHRLSLIHI